MLAMATVLGSERTQIVSGQASRLRLPIAPCSIGAQLQNWSVCAREHESLLDSTRLVQCFNSSRLHFNVVYTKLAPYELIRLSARVSGLEQEEEKTKTKINFSTSRHELSAFSLFFLLWPEFLCFQCARVLIEKSHTFTWL